MHRLLAVEVANWKVVTVLGLLALALLGRTVVRRRHTIIWVLVALMLSASAGADAVNTYFGYLPQVADVVGAQDWPSVPDREVVGPNVTPASPTVRRHGGVLALHVTGTASGFGRHRVLVYLPPAYFTARTERFPVVYLLHGSPGRPEDWLRANRLVVLAAAAAQEPIIYVMPPMSRGWLDDSECVDGAHERAETWLVADVVPEIDRVLRTIPDREHRAVAGNSAGGYCAMNLGLKHSTLFAAALDMSGYGEPTFDGGLRRLFGPMWRRDVALNTPSTYLRSTALTLPFALSFAEGRHDGRPLREALALLPELHERGVQTSVVTYSGGHTYHVWVPALRAGITWLGQFFYRPVRAVHRRSAAARPL